MHAYYIDVIYISTSEAANSYSTSAIGIYKHSEATIKSLRGYKTYGLNNIP